VDPTPRGPDWMQISPVAGSLFHEKEHTDVRIVVLDDGEEAFSTLQDFARDAGISAASLTAIGAFDRATVGWFDFASRRYKRSR